ncbi:MULTISPECIES: type VI secretion system Vgr family protein [unclassified Azospirillum]|uniref:type VI secretion system Vgr family protein n=1 Tax=unclassified Azospirillum TaxID=2630922 RepID=UPI000B6328DE|nr:MULTISPECIES: type VI secretion system tip protein VgrG [unclassified Azospirillum]SNS13064.1 type VI secretion system secreted protein VgrG [Azospirillum sp. RU38E]SNS30119.1 type VI secretion system secreted protein VgrG [Azospirillum sp. RU37A]
MSDAWTQGGQSLSLSTSLGKDKLVLREFTGQEGVCSLFSFDITATAETADTDLSSLIGQSPTVTLIGPDGAKRYINGVCVRAVQMESTCQLQLRPWLWQLSLTSGCRIFQNKTAPEIIKAVFSDLGFSDFKDSLTATYQAREYCVQYNETALNFVCRLMEDEGIFWFFTHADGKHTLVLADDASAHSNIPGTATLPYIPLPAEKGWVDLDRVESFTIETMMVSGKYQADDFAFDTPSTELKTSVSGKGKLQVYEYPGLYSKKSQGDALAKIRLAELEVPASRASGTGSVRAMAAGLKFTLSGHPKSAANAAYVLHQVDHHARFGSYSNSFAALPASATFRPPRTAHRPRIAGTQTAIVVGKAGEEIWTDKHGRIKVQFHWDQEGKKDENSSCWVRVAQGWAGKNWGSFFLPRIGQEVVVSFLEGDPDRPLVTGSVYNGEQPVPYALPDNQTKSTVKSNVSKGGGGYNEFRFEDKKGEEEVYLQAEKDFTQLVKNQRKATINEADDLLTIDKGNRTTTITKGNDTLTISEGDLTTQVAKGKETHSVKGTRAVTVEGDETHTSKADVTWNVTGDFTLKVNGNITIQAGGSITLKGGTSATMQAGTEATVKAGTAATMQAGTDATVKGLNVTAKADVGATLQGGVSAQVKGSASGTVDGGGMLTLKGGLVKIN